MPLLNTNHTKSTWLFLSHMIMIYFQRARLWYWTRIMEHVLWVTEIGYLKRFDFQWYFGRLNLNSPQNESFEFYIPARSVPSHYLNQCWNIVTLILRNKFQWNINRNSYEMHLKMSSAKWPLFWLGLNVLNCLRLSIIHRYMHIKYLW